MPRVTDKVSASGSLPIKEICSRRVESLALGKDGEIFREVRMHPISNGQDGGDVARSDGPPDK